MDKYLIWIVVGVAAFLFMNKSKAKKEQRQYELRKYQAYQKAITPTEEVIPGIYTELHRPPAWR